MKSVLRFLRTTLAGGILFLLPIVVLLILVGKMVDLARKVVAPLAAHLPVQSVIGLETPKLLAIVLLIFCCFLAGVLARMVIAQRAINWVESVALSSLPGYNFIKAFSQSLLTPEKQPEYSVVLARIEDAWQLAFLIECLDTGDVVVFVPGVPNPQSGSVYFMTEDRIRHVDIPFTSAVKCLRRYALGSNALLGNQLNSQTTTGSTSQTRNICKNEGNLDNREEIAKTFQD